MVSCTMPWCATRPVAGCVARPGHHPALLILAAAGLAGTGCSSDDSSTDSPFRTPVAPSDLRIERANDSEVVLTWVHDDTDETGFAVRRRVGAGGASVIAELPPDTEAYTDPDPHPTSPMAYAVEARYGGDGVLTPGEVSVDIDFLSPKIPFASIDGDTVTVTWLPPDFELFDGFQTRRILERDGNAYVNSTFQIEWSSSEQVRWDDGALPDGEVLDRLSYQVATTSGMRRSPPVATTRFQWSLPTNADAVALGTTHETAAARFIPSQGLGALSFQRADGTARADLIDPAADALDSRYLYQLDVDEGWVSAAAPSRDQAVFAYAPDGADSMSVIAFDVATEKEAWTLESRAPVPFVTEGPVVNTVLYADGTDLVQVAGESGAEISRTPIGSTVALAGVVNSMPARVAVVETRTARGATEVRVSARNLADGAALWAGPFAAGELLPGGGSLVIAPGGSLVALNLLESGQINTTIFDAASGAPIGTLAGRTLGFTADGSRAIVVEEPTSRARAYRLDEPPVAEDLLGASGVTASFLGAADDLWTFHTAGTIRVYMLRLYWTNEVIGRVGMYADGRISPRDDGVPRFELLGP